MESESREPSQTFNVASIMDCDVFELADRMLGAYPDSVPFEDFGPYRIQREPIGRGGMGEVFLAEDQAAGRRVAIKFLHNLWLAPDLPERFTREIKTLAKLEHPFIARLYDVGVHPSGTPYFAMEYVEGKPLDEYCREQQCSVDERLRLFRSVCEAVQYAHSLLIVHRDLKPSNILVKKDGTPKLLDFGIAKQLETPALPVSQTQTQPRFTAAFAAPEQLLGEPVGVYTDVYGLGVILYQLLTGKLPYDVEKCTPGQAEIIITGGEEPRKPSAVVNGNAQGTEASRPPSRLSRAAWNDLDVLCLKALKRDVQRRYHSVVELMQDIDHYLSGEPLKARADTLRYRASKFLGRNRRFVFASTAIVAVIAGLISFYTVRLARARDAALVQAARTQRIQRFMLSIFSGDDDSGPSQDLRVVTILDRGVREAQILGREPAVQIALYQTLGNIYQRLGNFNRADSLFQSSLGASRATFGWNSKEVFNSLVTLSLLRVDQARFADAERLARESLAINEHMPADHLAEARALTALGSVLEHSGNLIEARKVLERAVQLQSTPDVEKNDLLEGLTYLSNTQHMLGDNLTAGVLAERVLALDRQIYGDRHPRVAEDLSNLGQISEDLGKYSEAERYGREGLDVTRAWYGKDHIETALMSEGLAKTLVHEAKYDEAASLLKQALDTQERAVGKMHPFVSIALNWLGVVSLKRGDLKEAEADFQRMAEICRSVYGPNDSHVTLALFRLGQVRVAQNHYPSAEQIFRRCVQLFSQALSPDDVRTGAARVELGGVLLREQRYRDAEAQLLAGYKIVTNQHSASLESAMQARRDLVSAYTVLNSPDKAAKFRAELASSELTNP